MVRDFFDRRRDGPAKGKKDMIFLNPQKRQHHMVDTTAEMDRFLQHHLRAADRVERGQRYFVVMDVEASGAKHFWHERELRRKGETDEEIEARRRRSDQRRGCNEGSDSQRYWDDRYEDRKHGLLEGRVAMVQMSAVDDEFGNWTFAAVLLWLKILTTDFLLFPTALSSS